MLTPSRNRDIHGFDGPIKVSFGNYTYPIKDDFLRAAESQGIPIVDDLQDLTTGHGAEHWLKWINRDTGKPRPDTIHPSPHPLTIAAQDAGVTARTPTSTPPAPSTATSTSPATPR